MKEINFVIVCGLGFVYLVNAFEVSVCDKPDFPFGGGYGPRHEVYSASDIINYYCDAETYLSGNSTRVCEDSGDWSGDTPLCDTTVRFTGAYFSRLGSNTDYSSFQSEDYTVPIDGDLSTCAVIPRGNNETTWRASFHPRGKVFRIMLFLPKEVYVDYEAILYATVRDRDGRTYIEYNEVSCGRKTGFIDKAHWHVHECPKDIEKFMHVVIVSKGHHPLHLCEVKVYGEEFPTCSDPHRIILNGRLQLTRKTATLMCERGYTRSHDTRLECLHEGVWSRKHLYCKEKEWEVNNQPVEDIFDP